MRVAAGAAVGTVAYRAGQRGAQQGAVSDPGPDAAPAAPAAQPAAAGGGQDSTAERERLAKLHASGALTDDEFAAAKSQLLGI